MKTNIVLMLLIIGLFISGGAGAGANEWDVTSAGNLCESFGFTRGTDAFAQCMQTEYTKNSNKSSCKKLTNDIQDRAQSCRFRCWGTYGVGSSEVPACYGECNKELNKLPSGCE